MTMKRIASVSPPIRGKRKPGNGVANEEVKRTLENMLMIRMLAYSAMKIRANLPPPYSMLNPETSSDSPSAKSNGARFVSASIVVNQDVARGGKSRSPHEVAEKSGEVKFRVLSITRALMRKRAIEIS